MQKPNAQGPNEGKRPANPLDKPTLWTVANLSHYLGLHEKTVRRMAGRGTLPCLRIGSRLRFVPSDITRWVSARKEGR